MNQVSARLESLREMYKKEPRDGFVAYGLAMELAKSPAAEDEAVRTFRKLLDDVPEYLPAYLQLGLLLVRRGEEADAKKVYSQGIALAHKQGDRHTQAELETALNML